MRVASLLLLLLGLLYIPGPGGSGVELPYNLSFIAWLGVLSLILVWRIQHWTPPQRQPLLTAGAVLLLLPWLIQAHGYTGVWVLLAAFIIWQVLLRLPFSASRKRCVVKMVFVLALAQAFICLIQAFCPSLAARLYEFDWLHNHGRPYGIFQQVNLLASFVASGVGCGVWLLFSTRRRRYIAGYLTGLGLLVFVLALNQSRAGAIGAALITLVLAGLISRNAPRRTVLLFAICTLAVFAGIWITQHVTVMVNGEPYLMARDYDHSNHERWYILTTTWQMIMQHPWAGWGYGNFEYAFSRYVLAHPTPGNSYSTVITHPHNEVLYAWFQGGIVALGGMALLFAGWMKMLNSGFKTQRITGMYGLLIIPLLVHLNLEYPFYQSFVHLGLFLFLLRLGVVERHSLAEPRPVRAWPRLLAGVCGVCLVAFSVTGLYANHQLTRLERAQFAAFPTPAPWYFALQGERAEFDGKIASLMNYNRNPDPNTLAEFMVWAMRWSARHNDKNIWRSMITIEQLRGNTANVAAMTQQYQQLFPEHP